MGVITLPVALTASFVAIVAWSGMRWSKLKSSTPAPSRLVGADELNHVVMGVAMVAMIWYPADFLGNLVQAIAFAAIACWWLLRIDTADDHTSHLVHAAMNLAMAAMFVVMAAMTYGVEEGGGHHGSGGGGAAPSPLASSSVLEILNYTAGAAMVVAGLWWIWRLIRSSTDRGALTCHTVMCFAMAAMFLGPAH